MGELQEERALTEDGRMACGKGSKRASLMSSSPRRDDSVLRISRQCRCNNMGFGSGEREDRSRRRKSRRRRRECVFEQGVQSNGRLRCVHASWFLLVWGTCRGEVGGCEQTRAPS